MDKKPKFQIPSFWIAISYLYSFMALLTVQNSISAHNSEKATLFSTQNCECL